MPIDSIGMHCKELRLISGHERLPTFRASRRRIVDQWRLPVRFDTVFERREFLQTFDM